MHFISKTKSRSRARTMDNMMLLKVYVPKYETEGQYWPTVHSSTIFSLVLMHVIAIGIFGLKKLPLASGLTLPLPVLTLLFNEYCQKRFLPLFKDYPAEPSKFMRLKISSSLSGGRMPSLSKSSRAERCSSSRSNAPSRFYTLCLTLRRLISLSKHFL